MKKTILNCKTKNMEEFRQLCEFAVKNGITHIAVTQIEETLWLWDRDRNDPYPNWGADFATIFKFVVPKELEKYIPLDYAARNLEALKQRAEILKEYGLKAVFEGMEPAWFTEEVYREHPEWRGPRCDQPRRSRKEYYAPCTDNEEVQQMYFEAVEKLCRVAPIEYFSFMTNDSGGGFCHSQRSYPGTNGPDRCAHIPLSERVTKFLSVIQKGAAAAGVTAEAGFERGFWPLELSSIVPYLKEGQFCCGHTNAGTAETKLVGWFQYQDPSYPIKDLPMHVRFLDMLNDARKSKNATIYYRIPSMDFPHYFTLIEKAQGKKVETVTDRLRVLNSLAADIVGKKAAEKLSDVWMYLDDVFDAMKHINSGGNVLFLGSVHQRWLSRPLVLFPNELTEEERSYYRPFIFQAGTEEEAENLINLQGNLWLQGYAGYMLVNKSAEVAVQALNRALGIIRELLKDAEGEGRAYLVKLTDKIKMKKCVIKNAVNVMHFQSIKDRTDYNTDLSESPVASEQGDIRFIKVSKIIRSEIDNTLEMISILERNSEDFLITAESHEKQSIMFITPKFKEDLKKKIEIMENHKYDVTRLYRSLNI